MGATLDGIVEATGAVFEAKFASHGRSPKRPPQKNIWHSCSTTCRWRTQSPLFYSIITGGGKWVELTVHAELINDFTSCALTVELSPRDPNSSDKPQSRQIASF
jgi:hypothetical protein